MALDDIAEERINEKFRRNIRRERNLKEKQTVDVFSQRRFKTLIDQPALSHRRYRTLAKQPRTGYMLNAPPKNGKHFQIDKYSKIPVEFKIPNILEKRITDAIGVQINPNARERHQFFYYFLSKLPQNAWKILEQEGYLQKYPYDSSIGKVEYSKYCKEFYLQGCFAVGEEIWKSVGSGSALHFNKEVSAKLLEACLHDKDALKALRLFNAFEVMLEQSLHGDSDITTYLDMDTADDACIVFFNDRSKHGVKNATFRRKRDMNPVNRNGDGKKPYKKRKMGSQIIEITRLSEPTDSESQSSRASRKQFTVQAHERFIGSYRSLYNACKYVFTGAQNSQYFQTHNHNIAEPIQIILRYLQSRRDRRLTVDIGQVLKMQNPVVNYRLERWAAEEEKRIIDINHLLGGRLKDELGRSVYLGNCDNSSQNAELVYVHKKYHQNPDRFVTTQKELELAVRRVLAGRMNLNDFQILDPRTLEILRFCEEVRVEGELPRRKMIQDIAYTKHPELIRRLQNNGLLNHSYTFRYS